MSRSHFNEYYREFSDLMKVLLEGNRDQETVEECKTLLKQMKLEARCSPDKEELMERIKVYKMQIDSIEVNLSREVLLGSSASTAAESQSDRMKEAEASASRQNEHLEQALKTLTETEEVAGSTLLELKCQQEKIKASKEKVGTFSDLAQSANVIVSNMSKPWFKRKAPKS